MSNRTAPDWARRLLRRPAAPPPEAPAAPDSPPALPAAIKPEPIGTIKITDLPPLQQVLWRDSIPDYVILAYRDFVNLVAKAGASHAPSVYGVLDVGDEHAFVTLRGGEFHGYLSGLDITGELDVTRYLASNPDVGEAISLQQTPSATQHYLFRGYFEGRQAFFRKIPETTP